MKKNDAKRTIFKSYKTRYEDILRARWLYQSSTNKVVEVYSGSYEEKLSKVHFKMNTSGGEIKLEFDINRRNRGKVDDYHSSNPSTLLYDELTDVLLDLQNYNEYNKKLEMKAAETVNRKKRDRRVTTECIDEIKENFPEELL